MFVRESQETIFKKIENSDSIMDGQHRMRKRDHPSEIEDTLDATLRSKKSKGDLKRYVFVPFIL